MSDHEVREVEVNGSAMTVQQGGSGPPLLFIHGEGGTSAWRDVHDALAESFTVCAPVLPGFGGSEVPAWVKGTADHVFHLLDLFKLLDIDQPVVVGESIGGWVATDLAVHRPDLVRGLVLIGALGMQPTQPMPDLFILEGSEVLEYLAISLDGSTLDPITGDTDAAVALWMDQAGQARIMWERPYDPSLTRRLHHIACPCTVLWGSVDRILPPEHGRVLAELIPGATIQIAEGAGHLVSIDAPNLVADTVRSLLS